MSTTKLHLSAPLEPITNVEKRLEKKIIDVNSFKNTDKNIREKITCFKDKSRKSKKYIKVIKFYPL